MSLLSGFLNKVNKQKDFSSPTDPKGTIYKQVEKRTVNNGDLVKDIGLQIDEPTALINAVTGNSLASRSGLVAGVYIYDINGKPIETGADVRAAFAEPRMGMSIKMLPRDGIEALMKVYSEMPVTSAESCLALDEAAYLARDAAAYGFLRPAHPLHKRWRARFDVLYSLKETTMKMRQEREAKAAEDMMRMADDDAMFELMLAGADGAAAAAQNAAPDVVAPITGISMSGPAAPASSSTIISHTVGSALEAVEAAGLFSSPAGADASEVVDLSTINHHSTAAGGSSTSPLPAGAANTTTAATDAVLMALLRGEAAPPTAAAAVTSPPPPPPLQAPAVLPADNDQLLALLQQQVLKAGAAAANGLIPTPNSVATIGAGGSLFAAPPMLPTPAAAVPATVPATTVGSATRGSCSPTPPPAGAPAVAVAGSEAASGGHSHSNNGQPTADTSGMTSAQLQLYHQRQQREAEEAAARLNSGNASSHHHHITNLATSAPSNQHSGGAGNGIFGSGPVNNNHNHASSSANNAAATSANANVSYRMTPEATYTLSDGSIVRTVIIHRLGPKPAPPTTHADPYDALVQHREAERTRRQTERDERKRAERGGRSGGKSGNTNGRSGGTSGAVRPGDGRGNPDGDRPCRDWLRGEGCVRSACKYRHDEKDREKERDRRGSGGRKRDRSRSRSRSRDRDGRRYGSGRKEEPRSNNHNNGRGNNNGKNNNNNSGGAKNGKGSAAQQAQPANGDSRRRL